jgi:4-hydroxy-tetrahydrodipicolinate reductase
MGRLVCETVASAADMELVAAVDPAAAGEDICGMTVAADLAAVREVATTVVDFTHPDVAPANLRWCVAHGLHVVVGTSGFTAGLLDELRGEVAAAAGHAAVVANFAIGAVLMMYLAEIAAPHMDRVEVIELHHDGKADAPSGTAIATAERLKAARDWPARGDSTELVSGTRGGQIGPVRVHAVRLPGVVASQEVLFGAQGQTLSIRHDTTDRTAFMPGVLLAVRGIAGRPGLTVGLEPFLGLDASAQSQRRPPPGMS